MDDTNSKSSGTSSGTRTCRLRTKGRSSGAWMHRLRTKGWSYHLSPEGVSIMDDTNNKPLLIVVFNTGFHMTNDASVV
jgi:hypothetical protein